MSNICELSLDNLISEKMEENLRDIQKYRSVLMQIKTLEQFYLERNKIIQGLFNIEDDIRETYQLAKSTLIVNKEINEFSTENILNLITKERQSCLLDNDMSGDNFTDNGQHDIFDLLRHFLNLVHPLVKQLFTYSTYYTFECECSNMITSASMDNCIYELTTLKNYLQICNLA